MGEVEQLLRKPFARIDLERVSMFEPSLASTSSALPDGLSTTGK